jgi:hypothetical protein
MLPHVYILNMHNWTLGIIFNHKIIIDPIAILVPYKIENIVTITNQNVILGDLIWWNMDEKLWLVAKWLVSFRIGVLHHVICNWCYLWLVQGV